MDFSFGFGLGSSAYLLSRYNPNTVYTWIVFNDNKSIVYNDGNNLGYRE